MPRPDVPVHWLRPNDKVWTPPSVLYWDTETRVVPGSNPETLALRYWVGHFFDRRPVRSKVIRDEWGDGTTPRQLAEWLTDVTRNRETVWAFAHNQSFDLATTRLPLALVAHGWAVSEASIGGKAPWLTMTRGKRTLTLVDSHSWLPQPLEELARKLGETKPPLPDDGAGLDRWAVRCRGDVEVLGAAMGELLDWWDRGERGRWAISGTACGWNAYRHTRSAQRVLIDPEPDRVADDRLALHGGRRTIWSVGEHRAGPFAELDFVAAYPTIAAHLPLPVERCIPFDSLPIDHKRVTSQRWGIAARCLIETDTPRWPCRVGRRTFYPVGTFWCNLAGPDIAEAARLRCLRAIGRGWTHKLGGNMQPWGLWVLDVMNGAADDAPPMARIAAKAWSRSVIGKWASRGFERTKLGPAPGAGWGYEEGVDHATGTPGGMVDIAGQRWWVAASGVSDNAYPAITAWVEAHVRVRLNRALEAIGDGATLQCDTDGMIVAERNVGVPSGHGRLQGLGGLPASSRTSFVLDAIAAELHPLVLRVKRRVSHVTVLGPQHMQVGAMRRYAGLPGTAVEEAPGRFRAKLWPGLSWQMANGSAVGYVRPEQTPTVTGPYPTGWLLADRACVPVEAVAREDGSTRIVGWDSSSYARAGLVPGEQQHAALVGLL